MNAEQKLRSASRIALYDYGVRGWAAPRFLMPTELRPLSIHDSIRHLKAQGTGRESYWLTAGQAATRAVLGGGRFDRGILKNLEGEAAAGAPLSTKFESFLGAAPSPSPGGIGGSLGVGALFESVAVQGLSESLRDAFQPCWDPSVPPIRLIDFDPETNITTSRVSVAVRHDRAHLAKRLDPTSWPDGSDGAFETYMVDGAEPTRMFKPGERPAKSRRTPGIGAAKGGRMFEHLTFSVDGTTQWDVENVLAVKYRVDEREIHLKYELDQSISSRTAMDSIAGGLDIDRGHCFAHRSLRNWSPGPPREEYKEHVRARVASEDEDDYLSPAILKMFMDMMVVEGVCPC